MFIIFLSDAVVAGVLLIAVLPLVFIGGDLPTIIRILTIMTGLPTVISSIFMYLLYKQDKEEGGYYHSKIISGSIFQILTAAGVVAVTYIFLKYESVYKHEVEDGITSFFSDIFDGVFAIIAIFALLFILSKQVLLLLDAKEYNSLTPKFICISNLIISIISVGALIFLLDS